MDWKDFIATMTGHLSWPVTLLALYLLLRDKISTLLEKLARLKYKDVELDFEEVRKQAEKLAEEVTSSDLAKPEAAVFSTLEEQVLEAAERAPVVSILLAWSAVETALTTAVTRLAGSAESPSYRSPLHNIEMLYGQGKISKQQSRLLNELRSLRNKIVHDTASQDSVSEAQALEYANASRALVSFLNSLDRVYKIVAIPTGAWVELPIGFTEPARKDRFNFWHYSSVALKESGLTAGVGPWSGGPGSDEYAYYGIDIELQTTDGNKTIVELLIDLSLVDPSLLSMKAADVVKYEKSQGLVTFNLGRSVFRYQLSGGASIAG